MYKWFGGQSIRLTFFYFIFASMALTFQQIYDKSMVVFDKAGSPYMPKDQFDTFFNMKYNSWVELESKQLEINEHYNSQLMYLFDTISKPNSNFIDRVVDTPNFRKRLRFNITFNDPCNSGVILTRNVRVLPNSVIDIMNIDPFNKPIDDEPLAIATKLINGNPGWQEFGNTVPLTLNMTFVKNPQVFNSATAPNTVFEGYDWVAYILIQLVVYRMDITIEALQRMQAEAQDVQPQLQG